jgi:hypothetical protein
LHFLCVLISTELSGFFSVGMGFIATVKTISSPVDIPPSIPPEEFVFLKYFPSL